MEEQQEHRSRIYWIFHNSRTKIKSWIKSGFAKRPWLFILIILVLLYTLFVSRSVIQPGVLVIRKYILLFILVYFVLRWYFRFIQRSTFKKSVLPTVYFLAFVVASWFFGPPLHKYISLYLHYSKLNKTMLTNLPETANERIQPIHSIMTLIKQEALSETEDATYPHFVRGVDGEYYFTSAVGPSSEYKIQQLSKNMYELINVPALLPSPVFSAKARREVDYDVGELLLFSKNTHTAVVKRFGLLKYLSYDANESFFIEKSKDNWVQIVPLTYWKGIVFPRPVFGGVMEIPAKSSSDSYIKRVLVGKGTYISPDEILLKDYLKGQNLLPAEVAEFTAESYRFVHGFWAPFPGYHEGDVRIPSYDNDQRPQPFVTYFKHDDGNKIYNYFGLEPYQKDKKSLSISLMIPGDNDGEVYFIDHRKTKNSFIGSSAIDVKIVESKKNYDWSKSYPAESRPFIRTVDGKQRLFWLSTIVTKAGDNAGEYISGSIPEICLTDAIYGKVVWIDQDSLTKSDSWINQAERSLKDYWNQED